MAVTLAMAEMLVAAPLGIAIVLLVVLFLRGRPVPVRAGTGGVAALIGLSLVLSFALGETPPGPDSLLLGGGIWLALVWSAYRFLMRRSGARRERS